MLRGDEKIVRQRRERRSREKARETYLGVFHRSTKFSRSLLPPRGKVLFERNDSELSYGPVITASLILIPVLACRLIRHVGGN